jgi:hypothetical protein
VHRKQQGELLPTTINLQMEKYSNTYSAHFFIDNFFVLGALGAGAAPKALTDVDLPVRGGVCPNVACASVTIAIGPAEGVACPSVALAEPDDGSTVTEGTSCSLTVSSPKTSPTLCFECLGFAELALKNQEKGENSIRIINIKRPKALAK